MVSNGSSTRCLWTYKISSEQWMTRARCKMDAPCLAAVAFLVVEILGSAKHEVGSDLAVLFVWLPWSIIVRDMEIFSECAVNKLKSREKRSRL